MYFCKVGIQFLCVFHICVIIQRVKPDYLWHLIHGSYVFVTAPTTHKREKETVATSFMLASCLAYSSTLKMEAKYSSYISVDFQQSTWRYISEDRAVHGEGNFRKKKEEKRRLRKGNIWLKFSFTLQRFELLQFRWHWKFSNSGFLLWFLYKTSF
jgi:hypothetical protein